MKTESNTYSAGAIIDYIPEYTRLQMEDVVIHPQHDDTNHRGGVSFTLNYMNMPTRYTVIHTWKDLFDLTMVSLETGEKVTDTDLFAGDFINQMEMLEVAHVEYMANVTEGWLKEELIEEVKLEEE
tara:strand:+ start:3935 stop:4312 length:378 start_codon:yes stop_codon:yes gene_type:complete